MAKKNNSPSLQFEEFKDKTNIKTSVPVKVLGLIFSSDDERRAYFREELRKKLPELRQIEGFPLGEDDDIVSLSDPPYYTACPNPWLNDFIQEWEQEKLQLHAEGKRSENFQVKEPYASDVSEGKSNPVYSAHTYHTKVPHPAIMRYILHYTQPGDIIFDGFAGTGMTGVAAQACEDISDEFHEKINDEFLTMFGVQPIWGKRHAICGDLSPYASMISYNYNTPVNAHSLKSEVERIFNEVEKECAWLYTTLHEGMPIGRINYMVWSDVMICSNCGKEFVYWDAVIDRDNKCIKDNFNCPYCHCEHSKNKTQRAFETIYDKILDKTVNTIKNTPVILVYSVNGKRYEKAADDFDKEQIYKIEKYDLKHFHPILVFPKGYNTEQPKRTQGYYYVHQFYTVRNLIALSILFDKIQKSKLPNKIKFIFTGMINRSTKMNRVHINNYFYGGGGWNAGHLKGTLYIPSLPVETSIIEQIQDKLSLYIRAIPFLPKNMDNCIYVASAENSSMYSNSVDYIFTDPPFGANINYSELNFLPEAWLKVITNNKTEAIENEAQGKNRSFYHDEMQKSFTEFYRILKPGKWMTVEFSNTSAAIWNFIQRAITSAGFVIANVAALDKKQGGIRSITTSTAVRQDLVISCYKPSETLLEEASSTKGPNIWEFVDEHLSHLPIHMIVGNSTSAIIERNPKIVYDRIISFYVQHGYPVPMDAGEFQQGLKERFVERDGMFFTATQVIEYDEKKKTFSDFVPIGLIVSDEANGIEWLKLELKVPQTYQELQPKWMQAVGAVRKGDIIPELRDILEENFLEEENGKWRIADIENQVDKGRIHHKSLMRDFNIYVETAKKPKAKLKEVRIEAVRAGFKQCYKDNDFQTIVIVGDKIPQNLLTEDEVLLQYYDIATSRV